MNGMKKQKNYKKYLPTFSSLVKSDADQLGIESNVFIAFWNSSRTSGLASLSSSCENRLRKLNLDGGLASLDLESLASDHDHKPHRAPDGSNYQQNRSINVIYKASIANISLNYCKPSGGIN